MIRNFTIEYKLRWVFEHLITALDPKVIKGQVVIRHNQQSFSGRELKSLVFVNDYNTDVDRLNSPFPDVQVKITEKRIVIIGSNFIYKFPPQMLVTIWSRLSHQI